MREKFSVIENIKTHVQYDSYVTNDGRVVEKEEKIQGVKKVLFLPNFELTILATLIYVIAVLDHFIDLISIVWSTLNQSKLPDGIM